MKQYWLNLQARERRLLVGSALLLLLLLIYLLLIEPWQQQTRSLQQSIAQQQETLLWMQQAAAEVRALRAQGQGAALQTGQSLMGLIDASARSAGIGAAIRQIRPDAQGATVRLENANFDDTMRWLGQLSSERGIQVSQFTMERLSEAGRINASVQLSGG
ncbi:MAG: type II secretion system protein GspM [Thiohalomonadaceae bacterium]